MNIDDQAIVPDEEQGAAGLDLRDCSSYELVKRPAFRSRPLENEILVTRRRSFAVYLKRADKLLRDPATKEIVLVGMGIAIPRTLDLTRAIQSQHASLEILPSTHSVLLFDEYRPLGPKLPTAVVPRFCSQITIRIRRPEL